MEPRQRLFIYDRKEMAVLVLLALTVALFAFTLGVHLGKRVGPKGMLTGANDPGLIEGVEDSVPNRAEIAEQAKGAPQAGDESLNQALHDEVSRTGIKLDRPRQVALPSETKTKTAGATTLEGLKAEKAEALKPSYENSVNSIPAAVRQSPPGRYTLQVGSFKTFPEARDRVETLEALAMKPVLRSVDLKTKGKWFRVYLGGYASKDEAEEAGARYKAKHMIDSFLVANRVD